jgi:hypothetical protein
MGWFKKDGLVSWLNGEESEFGKWVCGKMLGVVKKGEDWVVLRVMLGGCFGKWGDVIMDGCVVNVWLEKGKFWVLCGNRWKRVG